MEFRSVGGQKKYFKYKDCEAGDVLVQGKYLGTSPSKFGKDNHDFKPAEGPTVCLNSAGHLNYLIENNVQIGDMVQVTYEGTDVLDQGAFKGKEVHKFDVAIAEDGAQMDMGFDAEEIKEVEETVKEAAPKGAKATKKKAASKKSSTVDLSDLD